MLKDNYCLACSLKPCLKTLKPCRKVEKALAKEYVPKHRKTFYISSELIDRLYSIDPLDHYKDITNLKDYKRSRGKHTKYRE
jgi:hypothetical protein